MIAIHDNGIIQFNGCDATCRRVAIIHQNLCQSLISNLMTHHCHDAHLGSRRMPVLQAQKQRKSLPIQHHPSVFPLKLQEQRGDFRSRSFKFRVIRTDTHQHLGLGHVAPRSSAGLGCSAQDKIRTKLVARY
jgi:hypothetical protein